MMEDYFEKTGNMYYAGQEIEDIKPEYHYLVGATPEYVEMARDHSERITELNLSPEDIPKSPLTPEQDAKWRFFWKIGE
jgi:hypothetical protein